MYHKGRMCFHVIYENSGSCKIERPHNKCSPEITFLEVIHSYYIWLILIAPQLYIFTSVDTKFHMSCCFFMWIIRYQTRIEFDSMYHDIVIVHQTKLSDYSSLWILSLETVLPINLHDREFTCQVSKSFLLLYYSIFYWKRQCDKCYETFQPGGILKK